MKRQKLIKKSPTKDYILKKLPVLYFATFLFWRSTFFPNLEFFDSGVQSARAGLRPATKMYLKPMWKKLGHGWAHANDLTCTTL